jgi:hypothetical protein
MSGAAANAGATVERDALRAVVEAMDLLQGTAEVVSMWPFRLWLAWTHRRLLVRFVSTMDSQRARVRAVASNVAIRTDQIRSTFRTDPPSASDLRLLLKDTSVMLDELDMLRDVDLPKLADLPLPSTLRAAVLSFAEAVGSCRTRVEAEREVLLGVLEDVEDSEIVRARKDETTRSIDDVLADYGSRSATGLPS